MGDETSVAFCTIKVITVENLEYKFHNMTKQQVEQFKETVWVRGCNVRIDANTKEQVSPFRIKQVFFIDQVGRYSGTTETITNYQSPTQS